jgi:hypothetical protein
MRFNGLPTELMLPTVPIREIADSPSSYPCRRCLQDAEVGEAMLLVSYDPWQVDSVYRQPGPIFVHERDCTPAEPTELPEQQRRRTLSLRGYDVHGMTLVAEVVPGAEATERIAEVFDNPATDFIHLHNAGPGCFAARIDRD